MNRLLLAKAGPEQPSSMLVKKDIQRIGTTAYELPLYTFQYLDHGDRYQGVLAEEVLAVRPDAVRIGPDGVYLVDYAKLGIQLRRLN
jgi:hypothetical protein